MVTIKYFADATKNEFELHHCHTLADFLRERQFNRDELLSLRFYRGDILGEQIDTSDTSFLSISEGEIEVINADHLPQAGAIVLAAVAFVIGVVAAIVLTPDIKVPDVGNRKQQSATNSLGRPSNEPRIDQRIDDIFGYVANHTPPLWQVPYRIGVNDQETEVLLTCIGRGRYEYDLDNVRDGDTPYFRIPNSKVSIFGPGTYPGNGDPESNIGGLIDQPIGIYREPSELNPTELLPPNDLAVNAVDWRITTADNGDGTYTVSLYGVDILSKNIDLTTILLVGDEFDIRDFTRFDNTGTQVLYEVRYDQSGEYFVDYTFATGQQTDLDGSYTVNTVTEDTVTFITTNADWADLQNYKPVTIVYFSRNGFNPTSNNYVSFFTTNPRIIESGVLWVSAEAVTDETKMITETVNYYPSVASVTNNFVGPIFVDKSVTKLIVNLTSASGFYKLVSNNETSIDAIVEFEIDLLDSNGNAIPGSTYQIQRTYNSNPDNVRFSVYRTYEIDVSGRTNDLRISARRLTNRDKSSSVSNVDKIEWTSAYTFEPIPDGHDFGDATLMHTVVPSNSQSRLTKDRRTNLDVTRKVTQYLGNGQFGPAESYATDDFSQVLIHTALDPYIGGLELPDVNADGFLMLSQQITDYFGGDTDMIRFGYDFDSTQMSYDDIFTLICNVVNCIPYVQNGVYDAFFERRQDTSYMQITCRNKFIGSEKRKDLLERKYNGVELTYRNNETGINETIYVPDSQSTRPERFEFPGCTTPIQAYRRALRQYHKHIYHTFDVEFDVDEFGRVIVPGARIDSPDGTRFVRHKGNTDGYRVYDGEVVEVNGLTVELSEPVQFVDGESHYIQFTILDGYNSELILCTPGQDDFTVVLSQPPVESLYDGYSRDRTKFTFCSEQMRESIALIPQTIEFKLDNGQEVNTVTSINYDSRYYKGDLETL